MKTIGNILWFLFGGLIGGLAWTLAGKLIRRKIEPLEIHMQAFYIASALVVPPACVVDCARIIE